MIAFESAIPTPDGRMPVFIAAPDGDAAAPGVIVYMDVFGPREELRDICRRFASCGYAALLPNIFYRLGAPSFTPANRRDDVVDPRAQEANAATTIDMTMRDVGALLSFLDEGGARRPVSALGAVGYCMGGRHALAAAAARPDRVRAAASIHGGRLVTPLADSPHRLLDRLRACAYFAFARDDETCPDADQRLIEDKAAGSPGRIVCDRVEARHGWSFPDRWCFDAAASAHVGTRVAALLRQTL
jgi:carboxymethylenebutenolidase